MSDYNFFCGHCQSLICNDCRDIALEYTELHDIHRLVLIRAEEDLAQARLQIAQLKRQAELWQVNRYRWLRCDYHGLAEFRGE